jgi:hypothetical protein
MESGYKLSDPKLITTNPNYQELGPIGIVAWVQRDHSKLVTDHEWPALAAKLPESNLAGTEMNMLSTYSKKVIEGKGERKCYRCGSADHLRPDFPDPPKEGEHKEVNRAKPEDQRVRKPLASWKYIQPADLTKTYPDEAKRSWKFCTHCTCRVTGKEWFFQLSHLDTDHKENFRPEANLSLANDPSAGIPSGPPLVTATEPDEKEEADEDEITFNAAWCCAVANAPVDADEDEITFNAACNATWCRGVASAPVDDQDDEITFKKEYVDDEDITINAWCCAVANAPVSDTVVTHTPLKSKTLQEIDAK